jgi:23S rRNA pseudouridine2605 synthase
MKERLQKILAQAGVASRRKAEELISQGRVAIDGVTVTTMGTKIDPACHRITLDDKSLLSDEEKIYILLNKPAGYVTTLSDPQGRPIVTSLLQNIDTRIFPVGRLDINTEGALILTNDGDLAQKIQHPSFEINKTYVAVVEGHPSTEKLLKLEKGIELEGHRTWPAKIKVLRQGLHDATIEIIIHEGKKRQVRKMFDAIGHKVIHLKRTAYGKLKLTDLPTGKYRYLRDRDLALIFADKKTTLKK